MTLSVGQKLKNLKKSLMKVKVIFFDFIPIILPQNLSNNPIIHFKSYPVVFACSIFLARHDGSSITMKILRRIEMCAKEISNYLRISKSLYSCKPSLHCNIVLHFQFPLNIPNWKVSYKPEGNWFQKFKRENWRMPTLDYFWQIVLIMPRYVPRVIIQLHLWTWTQDRA